MNISPMWAKILGAVISAVMAAFQLPEPLGDIIRQIIDSLTNNPQAAGLFGVAAYLGGSALYEAKQGLPSWQKEAIKHGAGGFCAKTGEFQWKDESPIIIPEQKP